jgi:hypothetical protein
MYYHSQRAFLIFISTLFFTTVATNTLDFNQVVFVVLSQPDQRHIKIADETKDLLGENLLRDGIREPKVFDLHNDFPPLAGGWAIYPLLPFLYKFIDDTKWFVFLAENSRVRLQNLAKVLSSYPSDYGVFLVSISITIEYSKNVIVLITDLSGI